jgi:hypothetical protein
MAQENLPGGDLVEEGMSDLASGVESIASCLVAIGAPRLRGLGFKVPEHSLAVPEHRLYRLLAQQDSDGAHARYNALIRRLVSFERSYACAK